MDNPWKTLKRNYIYENKYGFRLRDDKVLTPGGNEGTYMVLERYDFVAVIAITPNNKVILVNQWRYPLEKAVTEIPAGNMEQGESPLEAAKRELIEETGFESSTWRLLSSYWVLNGACKIRGHIFLATDCERKQDQKLDPTEQINVRLKDWNLILKRAKNGEYEDERTIMGILLAQEFVTKK